jgi:transposase
MKIIEILRLHEMGMTQREIGKSAGCGKSTVGDVLRLCKNKGINHEIASKMTDYELQSVLRPKDDSSKRPEPDWDAIHEELAKHKSLNLQFMWEEYREQHPEDGLGYSRFCEIYREYRKDAGRSVSLYHERKAGEIMEVDWMGDTLECVVDDSTGEVIAAHFFVSALGYSHYPYVEAFPDEQEPAWLTAHVNALNHYGGLPRIITPDCCKTAVITPKYYEPTINSAYWEFAQHYGVAIVPARVKKPKDKPVVEYSVGWLETWLLGKLRNQFFFSFAELNRAILGHVRELSLREFKQREGSRHSEFIRVDKPALRPLPPHKYEIADIVKRKVGDNYHLEYGGFHYSVPYTQHGKELILRATANTIEVIDKERIRVDSHARKYSTAHGRYVTKEEHMPPNHRAVYQQRQFDGNRYRSWARRIGESTSFIIDSLLTSGKAEEQGYKSCMGVLQFSKTYGEERLESACKRARELGSHTYTTVKTILKNGLESAPAGTRATPDHVNIRGGGYYS